MFKSVLVLIKGSVLSVSSRISPWFCHLQSLTAGTGGSFLRVFSALMVWGKKLLLGLEDLAQTLCSLLPQDRSTKRWCDGWEGSCRMFLASLTHICLHRCRVCEYVWVGRRWSFLPPSLLVAGKRVFFLSAAEQLPNQTLMQCVRMLSDVLL